MAKTNELPALRDDQDIFAIFDQLDDEIILSELENRITDVWVYHFVVSGKEVWGISKEGVDQCVEKMAKKGMSLRDVELDYRVDPTNPEYILFSAKVQRVLCHEDGREVRVDAVIGTKRQRIMRVIKSEGRLVENEFWYEQGSQKALRNARLRLIPEDIKTTVIAFAKQKKKVRTIEAPKVIEEKKGSKFPDERQEADQEATSTTRKTSGFPDEKSKEKEKTATQEQIFGIYRLEAMLADKHGFTMDKIIAKLKEKWGITDITTKIPYDVADQIILYFNWVIKDLEAKRLER